MIDAGNIFVLSFRLSTAEIGSENPWPVQVLIFDSVRQTEIEPQSCSVGLTWDSPSVSVKW
jgi:hypothetical protein